MKKTLITAFSVLAGILLTSSLQQVAHANPTGTEPPTNGKVTAGIWISYFNGYYYDHDVKQWRWFDKSGLPYTGFQKHMGTYYYFKDGYRQNNQWVTMWGHKYYLDNNGRAVQGYQVVDGKAYNFGFDNTFYSRGLASGYVDAGQGWKWYDNGSKFTGFRFYMGTYYWFTNGVRQDNGWRTAWGLKYYTDNAGRAVQGWQNIAGKSYYFGNDGTFFLR